MPRTRADRLAALAAPGLAVDQRPMADFVALTKLRVIVMVLVTTLVGDPEGASTERHIVAGCLALLAVGLLPTLVGLTGGGYLVGALLLGAGFLACGTAHALAPSFASARRLLLLASVAYLPLLLTLMALDKAS